MKGWEKSLLVGSTITTWLVLGTTFIQTVKRKTQIRSALIENIILQPGDTFYASAITGTCYKAGDHWFSVGYNKYAPGATENDWWISSPKKYSLSAGAFSGLSTNPIDIRSDTPLGSKDAIVFCLDKDWNVIDYLVKTNAIEVAAPLEVPAITAARITKVEEVEDALPGPGNDLHVTVSVTFNNTGEFISSDYPDDASIEVRILNPACPAMEAEPLFFTRFGNRDIPPGVNTLDLILKEEIVYLTGYRTTPIGPGSTPVILRVRLTILGWEGDPYTEEEFSDTLVW